MRRTIEVFQTAAWVAERRETGGAVGTRGRQLEAVSSGVFPL